MDNNKQRSKDGVCFVRFVVIVVVVLLLSSVIKAILTKPGRHLCWELLELLEVREAWSQARAIKLGAGPGPRYRRARFPKSDFGGT